MISNVVLCATQSIDITNSYFEIEDVIDFEEFEEDVKKDLDIEKKIVTKVISLLESDIVITAPESFELPMSSVHIGYTSPPPEQN